MAKCENYFKEIHIVLALKFMYCINTFIITLSILNIVKVVVSFLNNV